MVESVWSNSASWIETWSGETVGTPARKKVLRTMIESKKALGVECPFCCKQKGCDAVVRCQVGAADIIGRRRAVCWSLPNLNLTTGRPNSFQSLLFNGEPRVSLLLSIRVDVSTSILDWPSRMI